MRKLVLLCLLGPFLAGCSMFHVHKVEIEQGNIVSSSAVQRLHLGMTEAQVKERMGTPILVNIVNKSVVDYVYTFQVGSNPRIEKRVTLVFGGGILQSIQTEGF